MERLTAHQIENLPEWMTIPGYPSYDVNCRAGIVRNSINLRVLKPRLSKNGYPTVILCEDRRHYTKTVHRIVANAAFGYYGIQTDGLCVCHLDEERNDPRIANLALGTNKENMNFEKAKERISDAMKGKHKSEEHRKKLSESRKGEKNHWFGKHLSEGHRKKISEAHPKKAVGAYKNGELIMIFESTMEADRNGFDSSHISACCRGKLRTHKGYEWRFRTI